MKKIFAMIVVFTLLFTMFSTKSYAKGEDVIPNDKTGIPDKGLYQAILEELGKKKGLFTKSEAAKIITLDAHNYDNKRKDIKNLKGIGHLTHLTSLDISGNKLTTLKGLEDAKQLEDLSATDNKLKNIKAIKKTTPLKHLDISGNKLSSLSGIEELKNLAFLSVTDNRLTTLSEVKGLINLETIYASFNKLTTLSGIENLVNLGALVVSHNKLTNLKEVENLTELWALGANHNNLKKLPDLRQHIWLDDENTFFHVNKIPQKELKEKLPLHLQKFSKWMKNQVKLQNVKEKIKLKEPKSFKKIKTETKKIVGITQKNASVKLLRKTKKVASVKANGKGVFKFKKLDLRKYKGKKLAIEISYRGSFISRKYFTVQ